MTKREIPLLLIFLFIVIALWVGLCSPAYAWDDRLEAAIYSAAERHGVSASQMIRVANCESKMGDYDFGDNRHSHGPFMLNDRPTGLLHHFHWVGYDNPYSYRQSADYFARVLAGEFSSDRANIYRFGIVRVNRWSCW